MTRQNFNYLKEIDPLLVILASQPERYFIEYVNTILIKTRQFAERMTRVVHFLDRSNKHMLAKAIRGELVLQEPEHEPAEALPSRIREARAETPNAKRGHREKVAAD